MSVLIAFATIEGQTGKIARFVQDEIAKAGEGVILFDVAEETRPVSFEGVDRVVLAAPVHERRHPKDFEVFLVSHREALAARRTLLLSISLSAAFPEGLAEANDYLVEMKMRTEFEADMEALVAGAVRSESYDYFQTQIVQHVVLRDHDYDPAKGAHEFTDWAALAKTLSGFMTEDA